MKKQDGFISMDILFALFILSLVSILLVSVLKNSGVFMDKNRDVSNLRLETQNIIDSINLDLNDPNREKLSYRDSLDINIKGGKIVIKKEKLGLDLWRLHIETRSYKDSNTVLKWVIVVESS